MTSTLLHLHTRPVKALLVGGWVLLFDTLVDTIIKKSFYKIVPKREIV